jgi:hypothetical protein
MGGDYKSPPMAMMPPLFTAGSSQLILGAAGDGDNRDHSFSAFRAARRSIHEILPIFHP